MELILAAGINNLKNIKGLVLPELGRGAVVERDERNLALLREDLDRFYTLGLPPLWRSHVQTLQEAKLSMVVGSRPPYQVDSKKEVVFGVFDPRVVGEDPYLYGRVRGHLGAINRALQEIQKYCLQTC